jgi:hypothetical protein
VVKFALVTPILALLVAFALHLCAHPAGPSLAHFSDPLLHCGYSTIISEPGDDGDGSTHAHIEKGENKRENKREREREREKREDISKERR